MPRNAKRLILRSSLWLAAALLVAAIGYASFFIYKLERLRAKVNPSSGSQGLLETVKSLAAGDQPLEGSDQGRINVLLLGAAGKGKPGQNLTDTIMVMSLNLETNQVALLSLPRDLYVKVPDSGYMTKINSVYQIGLNGSGNDPSEAAGLIEKTVSDITGLDIGYYVILDFDGFKQAIDAIGGVNVTSERDIYDASYPGPNYSYETFELKKGFHHLDGATALKYARERHDDPEGDFGRAKRQQQIMQAAKNRIFSAETLFDIAALNGLIDSLGDNIRTDIGPGEAQAFFELSKKLDTNNVNNVVVDAWNSDSLLKVSHVAVGNVQAFVLIPRISGYSEIRELAGNVFDLNAANRRKQEIADENASIVLIDKSGDASLIGKIRNLIADRFGYKSVTVATDPMRYEEDSSTAYDLSGGAKPFSLDEIAAKLPAKAAYDLPAGYLKVIGKLSKKDQPDIVVVIGKDLAEKYSMDEDSIEDYQRSQDDQNYLDFSNADALSGSNKNK